MNNKPKGRFCVNSEGMSFWSANSEAGEFRIDSIMDDALTAKMSLMSIKPKKISN